jgi:excisionase family DNA binding protein
MDDKPDLTPARHFTVQSLATYWGVSPSHIYNLIHSNALRHLRIGKAIRIPAIIVKEFEETACQITQRNTDFGNTPTEPSMSYGTTASKYPRASSTRKQGAFQQGQRIGKPLNNTAPNSSQD